ncbi:MAG TPA: hypothetical protein VGF56_06520 [Rhizomicrobium sp.]|jgi:hypothetical protein
MKRFLIALFALLLASPAFAGTAPSYNPPFGMWRIPLSQAGVLPYNLDGIAFDPDKGDTPATVIAALNQARAAKMHVFMSLVNGKQIGNWGSGYDVWCPGNQCMNLQPYVADGTLLGLHIVEFGGGRVELPGAPTIQDIQHIGQVVKSHWPYLPVAVDTAHPCSMVGANWHGAVDIVLITFYTGKRGDHAGGDTLMDQSAQCAKRAGLRYTMGPNPFGGSQLGFLPHGVENFTHYTEHALLYPDAMGVIVWRWWPAGTNTVTNGRQTVPDFWWNQINPGIDGALTELQGCAAKRTPAACPHA